MAQTEQPNAPELIADLQASGANNGDMRDDPRCDNVDQGAVPAIPQEN